jgi:thioredoxin reductase
MREKKHFDVIIVGASYSGLAAAMALGRALRKVLLIDSGLACNRQTPHSHNFLTQDGKSPKEIAALSRKQVLAYDTVELMNDLAIQGIKTQNGFEILTKSGKSYEATKLVFAAGIKDTIPIIPGFAECWGISVLHCPYCHGYEVRGSFTGILGNGDTGFDLTKLISNWTNHIMLFIQGKASFSSEQMNALKHHNIILEERAIQRIEHTNGRMESIVFEDDSAVQISTLYARLPFEQNCSIPVLLGCILSEEGYLKVDAMQKTNIDGIFACGDNTSRRRTVANAVSMGTTAGMMVNNVMIEEEFNKLKN